MPAEKVQGRYSPGASQYGRHLGNSGEDHDDFGALATRGLGEFCKEIVEALYSESFAGETADLPWARVVEPAGAGTFYLLLIGETV
ncbi:hypothetical protein [Streptomyces sp. SID3343]|uniref:hypothetical protein n=1 Tax=Streptomyces sp. SID3343 TaxID=2690260 RepID=UPI0013703B8C|nr:hypothetical protein [Streptomyces sp. SID3343]MYV99911.1 hypothetical protein [Streptomyces sp. SID3343]